MTEKNNLKTILYNEKGEKTGEIDIPEKFFGAKVNKPLMAQAVRVYLANQRRGTASTKTRTDVSGGGKKPWRQKGTGRARHGSTRSPIWVKGGISHGPQPKDWSLKMSKKMKKASLFSALTLRKNEEMLRVLENLDFKKPQTKEGNIFLENLKLDKKVLIVIPEKNDNIYLSFRNLEKIEVVVANQLNTYQILNHDYLVILKSGIRKMEEVFLREKKEVKNG